MAPRFFRYIIPVLSILLPLAAVTAAGVSVYFWQQARTSAASGIEVKPAESVAEAKPEAFAAEMDSVLIAFLSEYGIGKADIKRRDGNMGLRSMFTVNVPVTTSLTLLHLKALGLARSHGGTVLQGVESADRQTLTLTLGASARPTTVVTLKKKQGLEGRQAIAAVIIDDVGLRETGEIRKLLDLDLKITLSVLPFRKYSSEAIKLAEETETPCLLHMPMEPKLSAEEPGEGAILAGDPNALIRQKLIRAFSAVKGAEGMNNHMGSKATEDRRAMEAVMAYLQEKGYFAVDSRTTNHSVLFETAQKNRVKCAAMTGYIDVIGARDSIRMRLNELADSALKGGPVIIIGHDRTPTLDVLARELPRLAARGIQFVPVSEVVR